MAAADGVSAFSEEDAWDGEVGFITDVVRSQESNLADVDAYVCGPPPMVEAAMTVLTQLGAPEKRIYFDKFTTTGDPETDPVISAPVTGRASS